MIRQYVSHIRRMAVHDGLGHEDICVRLGIKSAEGRREVRRLVLSGLDDYRQLARQTMFHVKHLQPKEAVP
jgi:hypothetical protein